MTGTFTFDKFSPDSEKRSVTWDDGVLSGDPDLVQSFSQLARELEGTRVALPTSEGHERDHLQHGESMLVIILDYFESDCVVEGNTSFVPALPVGAVG